MTQKFRNMPNVIMIAMEPNGKGATRRQRVTAFYSRLGMQTPENLAE